MSIEISVWAYEAEAGGPLEKAVLLCMADCANQLGLVVGQSSRLLQRANATPDELERAVASLAGKGLIQLVDCWYGQRGFLLIGFYKDRYPQGVPEGVMEDLDDVISTAPLGFVRNTAS